MAIKFECPGCHRKLTVADAMAGKKGKCPACSTAVTIPSNGQAPSAAAPPAPPPPRTQPPSKPPSGVGPAHPLPTASPKGTNGEPEPAKKPASGASLPAAAPKGTNGNTGPAKKPASNSAIPNKPAPAKAAPAPPPKTPAPKPPVDVEAEAAAAFGDEAAKPKAAPEEIEFECEYCFEPVKLPVAEAGKRVPCPSCKRILKVPEPKKEKADWRDPNAALPSGAQKPAGPAPEGAWGAGQATRIGTKALIDEGILAADLPRRTVAERITTGVKWVVVLGLLSWGCFEGWHWWVERSEARALQDALKYADSDEGSDQLGRSGKAIAHTAALRFHRRARRSSSAAEAQAEFGKAYALLTAEGDRDENDFLLMDLALEAIDLGGKRDQVDAGFRIPWNEVHRSAAAALKEIRSAPARPVRLEALREVSRKLLARNQANRVLPLTTQVFSQGELIDPLAEMGLELAQGGAQSEAERASDRIKDLIKGAKGTFKVPASVIALAVIVKDTELTKLCAGATGNAKLLGESEGKARSGQRTEARKLIEPAVGDPILYLQALLGLGSTGVSARPPDSGDVEAAVSLVSGMQNRRWDGWALFRLVSLGIAGGVNEEKLLAAANRIEDPALRGRALLNLWRAHLARSGKVEADTDADDINPQPPGAYLGRLFLAEHNTRRDSAWPKTVRDWPQPLKAFGSLGIALGMQAGD